MQLVLTSPAFQGHARIPVRYTGQGEDYSPPLEWSGVPRGTREFVLICEDPDAPTDSAFVHWVIYNISPSVTYLPEGILPQPSVDVPVMATQGKNDFDRFGYGGPVPPVGHGIHRYVFKLYAIDRETNLPPGVSRDELLDAIDGHILDAAQLVGRYERQLRESAA